MPLPTSSFLTAAQILANEQGSSNIDIGTIRQGELAQQLEAMKHSRAHDLEERRTTILEARYEAQLKRAEEAEMRKLQIQQRKALESEQKRIAAEEKK
jgi:membrane protein involved in colicin uptake